MSSIFSLAHFIKAAKIILMMIQYAFILAFILFAISLLINIADYYVEKKKKLTAEINAHNVSLGRQISITNEMMKLIDDLILTEFGALLHRFAVLEHPYPIERLDDDVRITAMTVFEGCKKEIFDSDELCLTSSYMMRMITERTKTLALTSVYEYNRLHAEEEELE